MTRKRLITKVAKQIRENTGRSFINSIELAKAFLKCKTCFQEAGHIEGFVYESDPSVLREGYGYSYEDSLYETGEIYCKNSLNKWVIPRELYDLRERYF